MIEMAATGSLLADLAALAADPVGRQLTLHVIKPTTPLPLDPVYFFGRIDAATLIDLGYQDGVRYLRNPRPLAAPWPTDVTRMGTPAPAVAARLVLDGPFAFGPTDPGTGAKAGRRRRHFVASSRSPARRRPDRPSVAAPWRSPATWMRPDGRRVL